MRACGKYSFIFTAHGYFAAEVVAIKLTRRQQLGISVQLLLGKLQNFNECLRLGNAHSRQLGEAFRRQCAVMPLGFNGRLQPIPSNIIQNILCDRENNREENDLSLQRPFLDNHFLPILPGL